LETAKAVRVSNRGKALGHACMDDGKGAVYA
jgi:hypothetical protein